MVTKADLDRLLSFLPRDPNLLPKALAGIVYYAFDTDFLFYHTLSVVSWAKKVNEVIDRPVKPYLVEIAGWLHDIAQIEGHEGHAERGRIWAEEWLRGILPQEDLRLVLDGIENHGSSASPETILGHILRFSDALGVWDPTVIAWARVSSTCKEIRAFREKEMGKKIRVIEEYWERWPETRELTKRNVEEARRLVEC